MTGPSRGMLKAPLGCISLKNIWVVILQNINVASYGTVAFWKRYKLSYKKNKEQEGMDTTGRQRSRWNDPEPGMMLANTVIIHFEKAQREFLE